MTGNAHVATTAEARAAYEQTALARMGVPFEDAMRIECVREAVEASARWRADTTRAP